MAYKALLVVFCAIALVTCEENGKRNGRKSRFISFDTDKNDIQVSLDFTVPFLSIPIKQSVDSLLHGLPGLAIPKINLNPSALAFGSFIIMATSVLLPLFSKGFSAYETDRYYRVLDSTNEGSNILLDVTNHFMSVSRGCPLRIACWMSQRYNNLGSTKTVEQIIRNKLVSSMFNSSAVEKAVIRGREGYDCSLYEPCLISEELLPAIMKNFGILSTRNFS